MRTISHMKSRAGFTLVEMMIVVMIIGMLAAIGIPSFQKARAFAEKGNCVDTLRQLNGNLQMYMAEYGQTTVSTSTLGESTFLSYFQRERIPICPAGGSYDVGDEATGYVPVCSEAAIGHEL